jgi:hypothetical protein
MDVTVISGEFGEIAFVACATTPTERHLPVVDELFRRCGAVLFSNTQADLVAFRSFARLFGPETATGDVYVGHPELGWHAEYAYLPMRPKVLWFYCVTPAREGGETMLVDGERLYSRLPDNIREWLDARFLMFNMVLKPADWAMWVQADGADEASRILNTYSGVLANPLGEHEIALQFKTPLITATQFSKAPAFANTLLHAVNHRDYYGISLSNGTSVPEEVLTELVRLTDRCSLSVLWRATQFIMIDNSRFMHARSAYTDAARDLKFLCTRTYDVTQAVDPPLGAHD